MHYVTDLIEAVSFLGFWLYAGMGAAIVLIIIGASIRSRAMQAGNAVALLGLAIPIVALSAWLGLRGWKEIQMTPEDGKAKYYHIMQIYRGERPNPGYVEIQGVARYDLGVSMKFGSALFGTFSNKYCYPIVPPTHASDAPIIACSHGTSPGGSSEKVKLKGVLGIRPISTAVRTLFAENSRIKIPQDALLLDEGVPAPSPARGGILIALASILVIAFLVLFVRAVSRKTAVD